MNADTSSVIIASMAAITDKNLFAYCDSNPVVRIDTSGMYWETVLDVISLGYSTYCVIKDPTDGCNWGALAADAVCLVLPVVAGGGAMVKATKTVATKADASANIARGVKLVDKCNDAEKVGAIIIKQGGEIKLPTQIQMSKATDAWDDYLGINQTSINKYTGNYDANRIFSSDGTRSIRFANHEMKSIGTNKAHFHYEEWVYNPFNQVVTVYNKLQRLN